MYNIIEGEETEAEQVSKAPIVTMYARDEELNQNSASLSANRSGRTRVDSAVTALVPALMT
jgi:hypothetical protein